MLIRLTRAAEATIEAVLADSARRHGDDATQRYSELIQACLERIAERGDPPGAAIVAGLPEVRAYPMRLARTRVRSGLRVTTPRHVLLYRLGKDGMIEVLGLVHDRMLLAREAARLARQAGREQG